MAELKPPEQSPQLPSKPDRAQQAIIGLMVLLLAAPWLNPVATGPTPNVIPWLVSIACASVYVLLRTIAPHAVARVPALAWVVAASASCLIGLLQYFGAAAAFSPLLNIAPAGEAFANLRQRNQFATLTNLGLVALLSGLCFAQGRPGAGLQASRILAACSIAAAILLGAGNAASASRTGLLQLALVSALVFSYRWSDNTVIRRAWYASLVTYAIASVVLPHLAGLDPSASGILTRLKDGAPACASRLTLWANVLQLIGERPLTGWGWRELDYAHFMAVYPGERFCDILDNAHNLPLHLAVEFGVPVALMLCGVGAWLIWREQPWRETLCTRQLAWAGLALILLHSMLEYPLWYGPFQIATGLCLWSLWTTRRRSTDQGRWPALATEGNCRNDPGLRVRVAATGIASGMLLLATYAAWDYWRVSQIYLPPERRAAAYMDNTLQKISDSWLFADQVRFARLLTTELRPENAAEIHALAIGLLHFSPEARVVEKVMESAVMLGRDDEAIGYLIRYRLAFPKEHAVWSSANRAIAPLGETSPPASQ